MSEVVVFSPATATMQVAGHYPGDWTDIGSAVSRSTGTLCRGVISEAQLTALQADTRYQVMVIGDDWQVLRGGTGRQLWVSGTAAGGAGTKASPISLAEAASGALAGDTLWIAGDTGADLLSQLEIAVDNATIANVPGVSVNVDAWLKLSGDNAVVRGYGYGLCFICSDTDRETDVAGSEPANWPRTFGSLELAGNNPQIINIRIDNGGCLFDFGAHNSTLYGVLSTFVGWIGPDRNHGHGLYTHNNTDGTHTKTIRHCVWANSFDNCAGLFSASTNNIRNYNVTQNVTLGGGFVVGTDEGTVINVTLDGCVFVRSRLRLGVYWQTQAGTSLIARNCTLWLNGYDIEPFTGLTFQANRLYYGSYTADPGGAYAVGSNTYYAPALSYTYDGDVVTWAAWQAAGLDTDSSASGNAPPESFTVWVNEYDADFALACLYNAAEAATIVIDAPDGWASLRVHNTLDWDDTTDLTVTAGQVTVPMTTWTNPPPLGLAEPLASHMDRLPAFGCFVLERLT